MWLKIGKISRKYRFTNAALKTGTVKQEVIQSARMSYGVFFRTNGSEPEIPPRLENKSRRNVAASLTRVLFLSFFDRAANSKLPEIMVVSSHHTCTTP